MPARFATWSPGGARAVPRALSLVAALLALGGCTIERSSDDAAGRVDTVASVSGVADSAAGAAPASTPASAPAAMPGSPTEAAPGSSIDTGQAAVAGGALPDPQKVPPERRPWADMRLEVDLAARQLHVLRGDRRTASYPVGVGTTEWPTKTGEWTVSQVIWNPEWVPPDQTWADERDPKAPGAPDNPLGRAQLIYDPPRTVHGTNQPQSVGKATSHGSIRMRNADIVRLAREVQEASGAGEDDAWYRAAQTRRTEKRIVDLPKVVPITVK